MLFFRMLSERCLFLPLNHSKNKNPILGKTLPIGLKTPRIWNISLFQSLNFIKNKNMKSNETLILSIIEDLIYEGGDGNFAILNLSDDYYIQLVAAKNAVQVYCEAISDNYLPDDYQLTEAQIQQLKTLKWKAPDNPIGNFFCTHAADSDAGRAALAAFIMQTATSVYGCPMLTEDDIDINLD